MPNYPQMVPPELYGLQTRQVAPYLSTLPALLGNPEVRGLYQNPIQGAPIPGGAMVGGQELPLESMGRHPWEPVVTSREAQGLQPPVHGEAVLTDTPEGVRYVYQQRGPLPGDASAIAETGRRITVRMPFWPGVTPEPERQGPMSFGPEVFGPPEAFGPPAPTIAQGMTQQQPNGRQPFEQLNQVPPNPMQSAAQMPQGQMPQGQQQPGQQGGSNAMLMGILSAGLGILANNTGHYGAAGPAIGKGGQIGLGTYLQQSQQEIENKRRDALAKAEEARWQQQAGYNETMSGIAKNKSIREEENYQRRQTTLERFRSATTPEDRMAAAIDLAMESDSDSALATIMKQGGSQDVEKQLEGVSGKSGLHQWVARDKRTGKVLWSGEPYKSEGQTINVGDRAELIGRKAQIEADQKIVDTWAESSTAASKALLPIVRMERAAQDETTYAGFIGPYQQAVANALSSVGVPVDTTRLASSEEYEGQMAQWVRNNIKALGSGTAISNIDLAFTQQSGPGMAKSVLGKKLMLKAMRADMEWIQDAYQSARKYHRSHDYNMEGWQPPEYQIIDELKKPSISDIMKK